MKKKLIRIQYDDTMSKLSRLMTPGTERKSEELEEVMRHISSSAIPALKSRIEYVLELNFMIV
jgi:hypothetical protein